MKKRMVVVTLTHVVNIVVDKPVSTEVRLFSSRKKAERWLLDNYFYLARRRYFKGDPLDWCHEGEELWDRIDVDIEKYEIDDESDSVFRDFRYGSD